MFVLSGEMVTALIVALSVLCIVTVICMLLAAFIDAIITLCVETAKPKSERQMAKRFMHYYLTCFLALVPVILFAGVIEFLVLYELAMRAMIG